MVTQSADPNYRGSVTVSYTSMTAEQLQEDRLERAIQTGIVGVPMRHEMVRMNEEVQ